MKVFVAKQPVYNIREEIVGYELLYRNTANNVFPNIDGDQATSEVIINSFLNIGMERISEGKKCGIQFTENLLDKRVPYLFHPEDIVVKIANNVIPTEKIIRILKELNEKGYLISVHMNFLLYDLKNIDKIILPINFIEVDFLEDRNEKIFVIEEAAIKHDKNLLAEKIETKEAFDKARNNGYKFFQGFYFSKPLMESTFDIPIIFSWPFNKNGYLDEMEEDELVEMLAKDLSLSIKLLRLININSLNRDEKVCSIRSAIQLVGIEELKKWIHIFYPRNASQEVDLLSQEITRQTLTRAKLSETIAQQTGITMTSGYYIAGLMSTLEQIASYSKKDILDGLPLNEKIMDALFGKENEVKCVLDLVEAVEQAKWKEISEMCKKLNISERELFRVYAESLSWTTDLIQAEQNAITGEEPMLIH